MKKIIFAIAAAAAILSSCNKNVEQEERVGSLELKMHCSGDYVLAKTRAGAVPDVNDFRVVIRKTENNYTKVYEKASDIPAIIELPEGSYTVTATSPEPDASDAEALKWGAPAYSGSNSFSITVGRVQAIDVNCALSNMKVSINCSENFMNELSTFEISVSGGGKTAIWKRADIDAAEEAYFDVAPLEVQVSGKRALDSSEATQYLRISEANVHARDHHIINLDARTTGAAQFNAFGITIDPSVNERESNVDVPGFEEIPVDGGDENNDDPDDPGVKAPYVEWPGNPTFAVQDINDEVDADLIIYAPGVVKELTVTVSDNFKVALELAAGRDYLDLANPWEDLQNNLGDMIPMGAAVKGQTVVNFSLSGLVPLIAGVGTPGDDYVFNLYVKDELDQELTKSMRFHLPAE